MKKIFLFIVIPFTIYPAALSLHRNSSSRSCLRSASTADIPSSEAIDIPRPKGHTRTRSKSHIVEIPNDWASPSSSSEDTINTWLSGRHESSSTSRPTLSPIDVEKEEKWRKLRSAQFGSRHKRTCSEPTTQESEHLYGLMHLSEDLAQQYQQMISRCSSSEKLHEDAIRTQEGFKEDVGKLGYLFSLVETTDFEEYMKIISAQQRALDERTTAVETLLARCEALAQKVANVAEQQETVAQKVANVAEQQETVAQEFTTTRKNSEKRRSKTSSFLSSLSSKPT